MIVLRSGIPQSGIVEAGGKNIPGRITWNEYIRDRKEDWYGKS